MSADFTIDNPTGNESREVHRELVGHVGIAKRANELALLLSLSNEMASVRSKEDLARIITLKLKDLFRIRDYTILIINEDEKTWSHFVYDKDRSFKDLPEFEDYMNRKYPIEDGLFDRAISSNPYYLFDIYEILEWESAPFYIPYWKSVGVDYAVGIPLRIGNENIGLLYMQVENKESLKTMNYEVAVGVAAQVSIAVSNIIANEKGLKREAEKALLVSFGIDIASIRNKKDMLNLLHNKLKSTFSFQHSVICTVNEDRQTISVFLLDPDSSSRDHPDYHQLVNGKFHINDGLWDVALNADSPVIFDGEKLLKEGKGSLCIKVNYECGIREFTVVSLRNGDERIGFLMICSSKSNVLIRHQLTLLQGIAAQLSIAVANIIANDEIARQLVEINGYRQHRKRKRDIYRKK
jgi:formate hydrogenlyase transcriptional activator